jgi:Subtilase family
LEEVAFDMRQSDEDWFFDHHPERDPGWPDDADAAQGQIILPTAVLHRHGAVTLEPGRAAIIPGQREPNPTVYRVRTLMVPPDLLEGVALGTLNEVLAQVGMRLVRPELDERGEWGLRTLLDEARSRSPGGIADAAVEVLERLPEVAVLVPAREAARPVVIDAWVALQALRAAARPRERPDDALPVLAERDVRRIGLEHLLVGASVSGTRAESGISGVGMSSGHGLTAPGTATDSYVFPSGEARAPVRVVMDKPARRDHDACVQRYGRRPVMAVLDTGVRTQPWLDVLPGGSMSDDGFVTGDPNIQEAIYLKDLAAQQAGDRPRQLIQGVVDSPVTDDPLVGELDTETGHGTFIAGIVRQVEPDARVLAVRIMHSDGIVYEGDLTHALRLLAAHILAGRPKDKAAHVDVVSLSLGYYAESTPQDQNYTSGLWQILDQLLKLGVAVVASAGNFATSRKLWPAAFSEQPSAPGAAPLFSVGALNPDGSKALFSDGGRWVNAWASGASVVSVFPTDLNGSLNPQASVRARPAGPGLPSARAALDPDDYSGGFAVWSGTSFSAPLIAAHIVSALCTDAADPALGARLDVSGPEAAVQRAVTALATMGWPG